MKHFFKCPRYNWITLDNWNIHECNTSYEFSPVTQITTTINALKSKSVLKSVAVKLRTLCMIAIRAVERRIKENENFKRCSATAMAL